MLPPLVLQPVVENAVKHGAYGASSGVTEIIVATRKSGGYICIEVTDRNEGHYVAERVEEPVAAKKRNKRKSVGLENVRTRLTVQTGGTLEMESTGSGMKVTIMLPEP